MLVPDGFNTDPDENGDILMYPEGDRTVPPSGECRKKVSILIRSVDRRR